MINDYIIGALMLWAVISVAFLVYGVYMVRTKRHEKINDRPRK
jgi:hypothetical protein